MQGVGGVGLKGRSMLLPLIASCVVAGDQAVKYLVRTRLPLGEPVPFIGDFMWLTRVENTGGAFSILAGQRWLFMLAPSLVVIAILAIWALVRLEPVQAVALGLLGGGAAGNLFDRVAYGRVTDFLDVRWWPVFNVADIAVVSGVCLLGAWILLWHRDEQEQMAAPSPDSPVAGGEDVAGGPREDS